jgi:hypothetical protein
MALWIASTVAASIIGGVVTFGVGEYTRDRKMVEVTTRSSGNLASVPIAAANLEVMLNTPNGKEPIKTLVKYDVRLSNRSEQGADDLNVYLETPSSMELAEAPSITTVPPELRNAIRATTTKESSGNYRLTVSLLNPSQSVTISYFAFSRTQFLTNVAPLNAFVSKKDWTQRNVADEAPSNNRLDLWSVFVGAVGFLVFLFVTLIGSILVAMWRDGAFSEGFETRTVEMIDRFYKDRAAEIAANLLEEADESTTIAEIKRRGAEIAAEERYAHGARSTKTSSEDKKDG